MKGLPVSAYGVIKVRAIYIPVILNGCYTNVKDSYPCRLTG